jgi:hypothetical protein
MGNDWFDDWTYDPFASTPTNLSEQLINRFLQGESIYLEPVYKVTPKDISEFPWRHLGETG